MNSLTWMRAWPLLLAGLAVLLLWALWRRPTPPDAPAAVLGALRQARLASVERVTVYPLLAAQPGGEVRPFQLRTAAGVRPLLPGLHQLRPLAVDTATFRPLLEATVVVTLAAPLAQAWHLRGRDVVLRLATADTQDVALRAQSLLALRSTLLSRAVRHARDSVARARR